MAKFRMGQKVIVTLKDGNKISGKVEMKIDWENPFSFTAKKRN